MKENYNAQLVYETKEKNGTQYTNFYLLLADGLVKVAINLKTFNDKSLFARVKRYCDHTNGVK